MPSQRTLAPWRFAEIHEQKCIEVVEGKPREARYRNTGISSTGFSFAVLGPAEIIRPIKHLRIGLAIALPENGEGFGPLLEAVASVDARTFFVLTPREGAKPFPALRSLARYGRVIHANPERLRGVDDLRALVQALMPAMGESPFRHHRPRGSADRGTDDVEAALQVSAQGPAPATTTANP